MLIFLFGINNAYAKEEVVRAGYGKTCVATKTLTVDELKDFAGIIFRGQYLGSEYKLQKGLTLRELKFKVIDPIKGVSKKGSLKLNEWAMIQSPFADNTVIEGADYVFFFHTPSARQLTSLIGLEQGLVEIDENNKVKFSRRVKMAHKPGFKSRLISTAAVQQEEVKIQNYNQLKDFFQ